MAAIGDGAGAYRGRTPGPARFLPRLLCRGAIARHSSGTAPEVMPKAVGDGRRALGGPPARCGRPVHPRIVLSMGNKTFRQGHVAPWV